MKLTIKDILNSKKSLEIPNTVSEWNAINNTYYSAACSLKKTIEKEAKKKYLTKNYKYIIKEYELYDGKTFYVVGRYNKDNCYTECMNYSNPDNIWFTIRNDCNVDYYIDDDYTDMYLYWDKRHRIPCGFSFSISDIEKSNELGIDAKAFFEECRQKYLDEIDKENKEREKQDKEFIRQRELEEYNELKKKFENYEE